MTVGTEIFLGLALITLVLLGTQTSNHRMRDETMATQVSMRHKETGLLKDGFIGYSWTSLFWGFWPPLFRGDYGTAAVLFIILVFLGALTAGIANLIVMVIWPFMYNKHYTSKLIEKGYEFCDSEVANASASAAIGLSR